MSETKRYVNAITCIERGNLGFVGPEHGCTMGVWGLNTAGGLYEVKGVAGERWRMWLVTVGRCIAGAFPPRKRRGT